MSHERRDEFAQIRRVAVGEALEEHPEREDLAALEEPPQWGDQGRRDVEAGVEGAGREDDPAPQLS